MCVRTWSTHTRTNAYIPIPAIPLSSGPVVRSKWDDVDEDQDTETEQRWASHVWRVCERMHTIYWYRSLKVLPVSVKHSDY